MAPEGALSNRILYPFSFFQIRKSFRAMKTQTPTSAHGSPQHGEPHLRTAHMMGLDRVKLVLLPIRQPNQTVEALMEALTAID